METTLQFTITTVEGAELKQEIRCAPDATESVVNQVLAQYSQIGFLRKEGTKYTLIPASQIALATCDTQSALLVTAAPNDVAKVAAASNSLKRIK